MGFTVVVNAGQSLNYHLSCRELGNPQEFAIYADRRDGAATVFECRLHDAGHGATLPSWFFQFPNHPAYAYEGKAKPKKCLAALFLSLTTGVTTLKVG